MRDNMIELVDGGTDSEILGRIEDILGAAAPVRAQARGAVNFRGMQVRQAPAILTDLPAGVQAGPTGKLLPVPFTVATFTGAAVAGNLTARPQVPVRGKRLVIIAAGNTPAAQLIANGAVITSITIGAQNVFTNAGGVPVATFAPGAFGVDLLTQAAAPGIDIVIAVALPAAPGADTVTIAATLLAEAVS